MTLRARPAPLRLEHPTPQRPGESHAQWTWRESRQIRGLPTTKAEQAKEREAKGV